MKLPDKCTKIVVDYTNGQQETYCPTSKVEEFSECYEFKEEIGEGEEKRTYLRVIMTNSIRKIDFVSK